MYVILPRVCNWYCRSVVYTYSWTGMWLESLDLTWGAFSKFAKRDCQGRRVRLSFCSSVETARKKITRLPSEWFLLNLKSVDFSYTAKKLWVLLKYEKNSDCFIEDLSTFVIHHWIIFTSINISERIISLILLPINTIHTF